MSVAHLRHYDPWSVIVIALTLCLFLFALVLKGFTHDFLLETGVFLVSAKLVMLGHKSITSAQIADARLRQIENLLQEIKQNIRQN